MTEETFHLMLIIGLAIIVFIQVILMMQNNNMFRCLIMIHHNVVAHKDLMKSLLMHEQEETTDDVLSPDDLSAAAAWLHDGCTCAGDSECEYCKGLCPQCGGTGEHGTDYTGKYHNACQTCWGSGMRKEK